jgi:DNA repair protein RecN (Recombination protein N)
MLKNLYIKDFALMTKLEVEFDSDLNILLGETGSGKSLLIDALVLLCGGRASTDYVRSGAKKAILEATFDIHSKEINAILDENAIDIEDELIIRRDISAKGNSRAFVNDTPVTINILKEIGNNLADFHGQHDHQLLLNKDNHIIFLDSFAGNNVLVSEYQDGLKQLKEAMDILNKLQEEQAEYSQKYELLSFEYEEIMEIDPKPGEYDEVEKELSLIENSEHILSQTNELYERLYYSEHSARDNLLESKQILGELSQYSDEFASYIKECESAIISIEEIAKFSKSYSSSVDFDERRITVLRKRMSMLNMLRKKYGSYGGLIERKEFLDQEILKVSSFDQGLEAANKEVNKLRNELSLTASTLSEARTKVAIAFESGIIDKLAEMGIASSRFEVNIQQKTEESFESSLQSIENYIFLKNGIDLVQFLISTNLGETPKPLTEIASGGEISRVMLAIKSLVAGSDSMPLLVFDEIDTGISGRIAQKVGLVMKQLAENHQIISITHLPQIAALGDSMIKINKQETADATLITAQILDENEKNTEIAKLIGGENISESSIQSARELIEFGK